MTTELIDWADKRCQETHGMIGSMYLRCGAPAIMLIQHRGRSEGPYFMCLECGTHNVEHRDAELLATNDPRIVARYQKKG